MVLFRGVIRTKSSTSVSGAPVFWRHFASLNTSEGSSTSVDGVSKNATLKSICCNAEEHGWKNIEENLLDGFYSALGTFVGCYVSRHKFRCRDGQTVETIINALRDGRREIASSLLKELSPNLNCFTDILTFCATLPDALFALKTWNTMEDRDIIPHTISYDLMVKALCKGGYLDEAFKFIKCSGDGYPFCSGIAVYNTFLTASIHNRSWSYVDQCLTLMNDRKVGMNEETYTKLLKIAIWKKNLPAIFQTWESYNKYYSASAMTLQKFVCAFTRLEDIDSACQMLQYMVGLAIYQEKKIKHGLSNGAQLDVPIPLGSTKTNVSAGTNILFCRDCLEMDILARHKPGSFKKLLIRAFNDVIKASLSGGSNFELAESLISQIVTLGLQSTSNIYDTYIKALVREKRIPEALESLQLMRTMNINPLNSTLAFVSLACKYPSDISIVKEFVDRTAKPRSLHQYNHFLAVCNKLNLPDQAIRAFKKMRQHKFLPNTRTYELLYLLFGNVNSPYEAGNVPSQEECLRRTYLIEMDMAKHNVQHNYWTIMHLLKSFAEEDIMIEFARYLRMAEAIFPFIEKDDAATSVYNSVMYSLVKNRHSDVSIGMFKSMRTFGFRPDSVTYRTMIECCSSLRSYRFACAMVSMMLRDGYPINDVAYCNLIKVVSRCGDLDEAYRLLDTMRYERIQPDIFAYNPILKVACYQRRLDAVEILVEEMHRTKIKPDMTICQAVFNAYVHDSYYDTAVEALQVLCLRMIGLGDDISVKTLMSYAKQYLLHGEPEMEMQLHDCFKESKDELAFTLLILRWCYILDFPICWNPEQSFWSSKTSIAYDCMVKQLSLHG